MGSFLALFGVLPGFAWVFLADFSEIRSRAGFGQFLSSFCPQKHTLARPPGSPARLHCEISPKRTPQTVTVKRLKRGRERYEHGGHAREGTISQSRLETFSTFRQIFATAAFAHKLTQKRAPQNKRLRLCIADEGTVCSDIFELLSGLAPESFGGSDLSTFCSSSRLFPCSAFCCILLTRSQ